MERQIIDTIVAMNSTTDSAVRNQHHGELLELTKDKINFINSIIKILINDFSQQEKISVSIFFSSFLNNMILNKEIDDKDQKLIFKKLICVDPFVMPHISPLIGSILFFDDSDSKKSNYLIRPLLKKMTKNYEDVKYDTENDRLITFFTLFKIAVNCIQDKEKLLEKMKELKSNLADAGKTSINSLYQSFKNEDPEKVQAYSERILEFCKICEKAMDKMEDKAIYFFNSNWFAKIFYAIIFLGYPNEKVFFNWKESKLNKTIYSFKNIIIKIVFQMITRIRLHEYMEKGENTDFEKLFSACCVTFLAELIELGSDKEIEILLEIDELKDWVISILTTVSQLTYVNEFKEEYLNYGTRLITYVGFTFLRTFREENDEMSKNPIEFVNLALDACDQQEYVTLKSQTSKFIKTIWDELQEVFENVRALAFEVLEYWVSEDVNFDNYTFLKTHSDGLYFLHNSSKEDLIDWSLMMLAVVRNAFPRYGGVKEKYALVVKKITPVIIERNNLLLNCRLTVMLGYCMPLMLWEFIDDDDEMLIKVINFLLNFLTAGEDKLAMAYQSSAALNMIIKDKFIIRRITPYLGDLLERVSGLILEVNIPQFFEFVSEIFNFYKKHITEDSFINILNHLVNRIQLEVPKGKSKTKNNEVVVNFTMAANKWWNIIMTILENKTYIKKYIVQIEKCMWPLYELLSDQVTIGFDDDILKSIQILITNMRLEMKPWRSCSLT